MTDSHTGRRQMTISVLNVEETRDRLAQILQEKIFSTNIYFLIL